MVVKEMKTRRQGLEMNLSLQTRDSDKFSSCLDLRVSNRLERLQLSIFRRQLLLSKHLYTGFHTETQNKKVSSKTGRFSSSACYRQNT